MFVILKLATTNSGCSGASELRQKDLRQLFESVPKSKEDLARIPPETLAALPFFLRCIVLHRRKHIDSALESPLIQHLFSSRVWSHGWPRQVHPSWLRSECA